MGTGEIKLCLAEKAPPFCPSVLAPPHPAPTPQPPSVSMSLIHLLCKDAPPAVGMYAASQGITGVQDGRRSIMEMQMCDMYAEYMHS